MKWLTYSMYGLFGTLLIFGVALLASPVLPYVGHIEVKIVKSGSMEPSIQTGSIVLIRAAESYAIGDVVTFTSRTADIPTTHRIVSEEVFEGNRMLITKGDANEERDADPLFVEDIIGRVLFTVPYLGFVLDFARQPMGFALLIGVPALLIIIDEVEKIWREIRRVRGGAQSPVPRTTPLPTRQAIEPLIIPPFAPRRVRMHDMKTRTVAATTLPDEGEAKKTAHRLRRFDIVSAATAFVLTLSAVVGPTVGSTVSFARDYEGTRGNSFVASSVGFALSPLTTTIAFANRTLDEGGEYTHETEITLELTSVPLVYEINTEYVEGATYLCDAVRVASTDVSFDEAFSNLTATGAVLGSTWPLIFDLAPGDYGAGDTCMMSVRLKAWDASFPEPQSYLDEEVLTFTFTAPGDLAPKTAEEAPLVSRTLEIVDGGGSGDQEPLPVVEEVIVPDTVVPEVGTSEEVVVPTEDVPPPTVPEEPTPTPEPTPEPEPVPPEVGEAPTE
jgi:signal peptidase I